MTAAADLLLDPIRMVRDFETGLPRPVAIWGRALNLPQLVGGVIFIAEPEGALVLAGVILAMISAGRIHRFHPFSKLIGICHAWWLPVIPFVALRLASGEGSVFFLAWLAYTLVTMLVCIALDIRDFDRWLRGAAGDHRRPEAAS